MDRLAMSDLAPPSGPRFTYWNPTTENYELAKPRLTTTQIRGWVAIPTPEYSAADLRQWWTPAEEIVVRIMTQHWDMAACDCWVCEAGRAADLHPNSAFLSGRRGGRRDAVRVVERIAA